MEKKVLNIITNIFIILIVSIVSLLIGARLIGFQVYTVLSGSMEPTYHTGSLIYVKKVDPKELKVGDVITFMLNEKTTATHRIIEVIPDESDSDTIRFRTKGDANEFEDSSLVHYKNVIGSPVFTIPYMGYVANYIQHPPGMYIAITAGVIILLLTFLPDLFDDEKKNKKNSTDDRIIKQG